MGVIKGIHPSVNVEDIKASADCGSSELLSVTHLPQYSGGIKEESSAVKLGFVGTQCPSHIYVGFTRYAVFPFNAPSRHCYCCQQLGHVAVSCNSPLRCLVCSGPHTKDECTAEPRQEKCANCHQTHIASSKECPAIRNAAAIQKLQCSGVGFEAAKHKVMKTQTELATKAPFMKKQNLTVPIVSSNIVGSQHSIQGNQQENQNDLTIQEVIVDIHQSGGSYLWSDAEALSSTASSSPLYSSVVQGLVDLPSTSEHFQLSGVQERTPSMNITQPAKKPSPQMTTAAECAEILSKSVVSLGKKLEHQVKEMGWEMGSRVIQRLSLELKNKMESVITEVSHTILSKVSSLLSDLILANMQKELPPQRQLLLAGIIRNHFGTEYSEPIITSCRNQENKSPSKNMAASQYTAPKPNFVEYVATWCPRVGGARGGGGGLAILRISLAVHLKHQWEGKHAKLPSWRATCNSIRKSKDISKHFRRHSPTTATMGSDESIRVNNANYFETEESREVPCLTMEELNSSLSALKNKAPGQDGVYDRFLQKLPRHWKKELLCVYNTSLYTRCVPPGWKWGIWLPILKPGKDPEQVSSYRPICLLSCIDLPVADGVQLIIYADDITILSKGYSLTEVRTCLQRYLDSLAAWFKKWKLIVNPAKCSQQIFIKKHSIPDVILRLNNSVVRNVTCQGVLGIVFDAPRLTFAAHIGNLVGDLRKRLQVLRALSAARWGASRLFLRRVYIAFIRSKLEYGWPAWGMLHSSSLKKLAVIQNTALCNILGVRKTSPVLSLEVESRIPPLELRLQLLTARWYIRLMNRGNHDYTLKQLGLARRGQQTVFETQARQVLVSMKALIPRRV
ncbi:Reverse transcriptase domain [Trinorchestia longiramus]|nr:Reverse transcriptase domain [Trinorchestia longiramus]